MYSLTRFEEEDCDLPKVEVDEVLGFMCNIRAEVPADNAVPCWVVLFVEFLLDESGNVFLDVEFLKSLG